MIPSTGAGAVSSLPWSFHFFCVCRLHSISWLWENESLRWFLRSRSAASGSCWSPGFCWGWTEHQWSTLAVSAPRGKLSSTHTALTCCIAAADLCGESEQSIKTIWCPCRCWEEGGAGAQGLGFNAKTIVRLIKKELIQRLTSGRSYWIICVLLLCATAFLTVERWNPEWASSQSGKVLEWSSVQQMIAVLTGRDSLPPQFTAALKQDRKAAADWSLGSLIFWK